MGSSLSPLLGAVALLCWDREMESLGLTHIRFMDDLLVFTKTRNQLRRCVKKTYEVLDAWKFKLHTGAKTFIGRIEKGFDYCGFYFKPDRVTLSIACLARHADRKRQLYERALYFKKVSLEEALCIVRLYELHFIKWCLLVFDKKKVPELSGTLSNCFKLFYF